MAEQIKVANESVIEPEITIKQPAPGADFNPVEDVIYRRRSVRFYKKKQVPEYLIRRMLETARFAPSAGNGQTWKFIVVRNQGMINEMTKDVVSLLRLQMKFADYMTKPNKLKEWYAKFLQRVDNNAFHPIPLAAMKLIAEEKLGLWHGAPTVILIMADKRSPGDPSLDVGIAGQNLVLTAHSFGLGTCWVSFCAIPLSLRLKWRKRLGIRYPYKLVTSVAVGYPRGVPDGYVARETTAIDWFDEDGTFKVVY
jgi:nitroreductase